MSPEIESQSTEDVYEVVGGDDGRTPESMAQFLEQLESGWEYPALATLNLEPDPTPVLDPPAIGDELDEPDPVVEGQDPPPTPVVTPPATPTEGHVLVNGKEIPLEDIQRLYDFDQFLRQNPDAAQRVQAAVQPVVPAPADPPAPANQEVALTPPEFLDLEDPAQKFMWDSYVRTQTELAQINQRDSIRERQVSQSRAVADMDQALTQWKTAHPNFNEDQIIEVRKHAAQMNVIDSLLATSSTPVDALVRAMDLAALDNPTLRTVYLDPEIHKTQTAKQRSDTRKGKLSSLGGGSGSAPRTSTTPRPMSDREATAQFAKELADSFQNQ